MVDIEDEDDFLEKVLEIDIEDVQKISEKSFGVTCAPESYFEVKDFYKNQELLCQILKLH